MAGPDARQAVTAVWRAEAARVVAGLVRMTGDLDLAEDLAQDALVAAMQQWPESGVPDNPGAWLMAVSKRRAVDHFRRADRTRRLHAELSHTALTDQEPSMPDLDAAFDRIDDDVLRLMFVSCHPVLTTESRVALTLRLLGGLTTREIARAFLSSEATVAQRISRAKRTLAEARVPFEVPPPAERAGRLASVLEVIYLVFNEGYSATAGDDWMRPALCQDAMRLAAMVAELAPREPEAHGLLALTQLQASRTHARTGPSGEPILLRDQDRSRWDDLLIHRGLAALDRARSLADRPGPYTLQAAIAACHARAATVEDTDWPQVARWYDELAQVAPTPVVRLNRAVAHGMAFGAARGLELVDELRDEAALLRYHLLPSVRGDLLAELGRTTEARVEFERAAALTANERERSLLLARACRAKPPPRA